MGAVDERKGYLYESSSHNLLLGQMLLMRAFATNTLSIRFVLTRGWAKSWTIQTWMVHRFNITAFLTIISSKFCFVRFICFCYCARKCYEICSSSLSHAHSASYVSSSPSEPWITLVTLAPSPDSSRPAPAPVRYRPWIEMHAALSGLYRWGRAFPRSQGCM